MVFYAEYLRTEKSDVFLTGNPMETGGIKDWRWHPVIPNAYVETLVQVAGSFSVVGWVYQGVGCDGLPVFEDPPSPLPSPRYHSSSS